MAVFGKTEEEMVATIKERGMIIRGAGEIGNVRIDFVIGNEITNLIIKATGSNYIYTIKKGDVEKKFSTKAPWDIKGSKRCELYKSFSEVFKEIGMVDFGEPTDERNLQRFKTELNAAEFELREKLGETLDDKTSTKIAEKDKGIPRGRVYKDGDKLYLQITDKEYFFVDLEENRTGTVKIGYNKSDQEWYMTTDKIYANAALSDWTVNESFLGEDINRYSCKINYANGNKPKTIKGLILEELNKKMNDSGSLTGTRYGAEMVMGSKAIFTECRMMKYTKRPPWDGFFIIDNKLMCEGRDFTLPSVDEAREALETLERFVEEDNEHFKNEIAIILRWLMIAPFSFAKKQMGTNLMESMYCYGKSRAGKSVLGTLGMHIWQLKREKYVLGMANVDTSPRLRQEISKSTYPILIDEGEDLFLKKSITTNLKTSVENIWYGGTYTGDGDFLKVPALSSLYITSNANKPKKMELAARFKQIFFTYDGVKTKGEMTAFDEKWKPRYEDSDLKVLCAIGRFTAVTFLENNDLLMDEWSNTATNILIDLYKYAGIDMPAWLKNFRIPDTTEEDFAEDQDSKRGKLLTLIEKMGRMSAGKVVDTVTKEGNKTEDNEDIDLLIKTRIGHYIDHGHVPFLVSRYKMGGQWGGKNKIILTKRVEDIYLREYSENIGLPGFAEILDGDYAKVSVGGKKQLTVVVDRDKFLNMWKVDEIEEDVWGYED